MPLEKKCLWFVSKLQLTGENLSSRLIFNKLNELSVRHNDLYIPGKSIENFLSRYCTSLGVWTESEIYPIYSPGSATLLKYRGRYFLVCTRHQLDHTNFQSVCILRPHSEGRTSCITSNGARWFDGAIDGDHQQIVIFDFTEPCHAIPDLQSIFFDFRQQHPDMPANRIVAFITYGYPTAFANFDYERGKITQVQKRVLSQFAKPGTDTALHIIDPKDPLDFNPDGMSGGPTFCLTLDQHEGFSVHLAGVTVRGGRSRLMVIKAGAVQAMLDAVIKD